MFARFCLYSILKNLRFFEPFFVLYLLAPASLGGPGLSFLSIGTLVGYQKLLTGTLEIPLGMATDRWGRRRALAACFGCYVVAFPVYAWSSRLTGGAQLLALYAAQTAFALGEALRTGSHKAIMLDWADQTGRGGEATRILGVTRFFSKTSAGLSALAGGLILYVAGRFEPLFWASTVPAVAGMFLMLSYPSWLEGEMSRRAPGESAPALRDQLRRLVGAPGLIRLLVLSVCFEAGIKLAQLYLQPYLKTGLQTKDIAIVGGIGALLVGVYYLVQDLLGGLSAALAAPAERRLGPGPPSLIRIHLAAALACLGAALCFGWGWMGIGAVGFILLAVLQNLRRPIFVSALNRRMDKPQRATTLSLDSQLRTWLVAGAAPLTGLIADRLGLDWALLAIAGLMALGLTAWVGWGTGDGNRDENSA